jgi:hypothetical protein
VCAKCRYRHLAHTQRTVNLQKREHLMQILLAKLFASYRLHVAICPPILLSGAGVFLEKHNWHPSLGILFIIPRRHLFRMRSRILYRACRTSIRIILSRNHAFMPFPKAFCVRPIYSITVERSIINCFMFHLGVRICAYERRFRIFASRPFLQQLQRHAIAVRTHFPAIARLMRPHVY